jgi:hypothetical protein
MYCFFMLIFPSLSRGKKASDLRELDVLVECFVSFFQTKLIQFQKLRYKDHSNFQT